MKEIKTYIYSSDISIVIQGPLYRNPRSKNHIGILETLPFVKRNFPDAEIIISTWEEEDTEGLEVDKIIKSKDPKGFVDKNKSNRNFNRQIISTREGIIQASRPYVLKTRADIIFTSPEIAQIASKRGELLLKTPITLTNMVFRNHYKIPFLFHPSDVVQFGVREDLLDIWDIPLEEFSEVATDGKKNVLFRYSSSCFKYHPEQSMCTRWLNKHGFDIHLKGPSQISYDLFKIWEKVLINNFHIVDYEKSGIKFPHHFYNSAYGTKSLLTNSNLKKISNKLVQNKDNQKLRYWGLWMNKYILAFTKKTYLLSLVANLVFVFSPTLNQKIFALYRKVRPR